MLAAMNTGVARNGDVELSYEVLGAPDREPLLLVMGLGMQRISWPDDFCAGLVERGFTVARFDNRDSGESTHFTAAGRPSVVALFTRPEAVAPYRLDDMADDAVAVLDALGWSSAHVVGASMGGMIAAERMVDVFRTIGSPGFPLDEVWLRDTGRRAFQRGHADAGAVPRQLAAINASGDRRPGLSRVRVPTLVVHGDSDPLVQPAGGRATAAAVPGARLVTYKGMGHDFPRELWPAIQDEIAKLAANAPS
jgi:pimeloyl-ACP methyl ester carboxylesterase